MRSFARARSSSRRAPPIAASKPCSSIASSSVVVCSWLRDARGPVCSTTRPLSIDSCTLATTMRSPSSSTRRSRYSITSGKLWPVSTCITGNGNFAGTERLLREPQHHDRVLAAGEEQHGPLTLGGDLAHDVDRLGLELVEVRQHSSPGHLGLDEPQLDEARRARRAADSVGVWPLVSMRSSGSSGASYGAETPVKSFSSPENALAYRPFGSRRAHSSSGVATCTSTNGACGSISWRA